MKRDIVNKVHAGYWPRFMLPICNRDLRKFLPAAGRAAIETETTHGFNQAGVTKSRSAMEPRSMTDRVLAISLIVAGLLGVQSPSLADTNEPKIQGPWAYMERSEGPTRSIDYVAITSAIEDRDTFLVLVCSKDEDLTAAIVRPDSFAYQLGESLLRMSLQLDDSPTVAVTAAPIKGKQLTFHPQMARDLIPLIAQSKTMIASVPEINGRLHIYSFSLQPNDLALQEIGLRCYHQNR